MEGNSRCAIVLGEQSLLVQCGELLLKHRVKLSAVVSTNEVVLDWCDQHNIPVYSSYLQLKNKFSEAEVDFIFSITNLKMLPDWLLSIGRQAINFHDGPLPRYAGLNAPVWAILNNETDHGVTWHEMTANADEGRILSQQGFPIVPGETALSINAKCYQAGLESFAGLLEPLLTGSVQAKTQDLQQRSYFGLNKRPEAAGLIDWRQSVDQIERMVRALDHGTYRNPLVTPKLILGQQVLCVGKARVHDKSSRSQAGEVVAIDSLHIRVACSDGVLELEQLTNLKGESVGCLQQLARLDQVSVGSVLPAVSSEIRVQLGERLEEVCRYEEAWVGDYLNAEAVNVPYVSQNGGAQDWQSLAIDLPANALTQRAYQAQPQAYMLALFSALVGRLNSKSDFSWSIDQPEPEAIARFFERFKPLAVSIDSDQVFSHLIDQCNQRLARFNKRGAVAADAWGREPALAGHGRLDEFPIKLSFSETVDPDLLGQDRSTQLYLCLPETGEGARLFFNAEKIAPSAASQLLSQLNVLATQVADSPEKLLAEMSVLSEQDLASFERWNDSSQAYDRAKCLHHLIEEQALAAPANDALAFETQSIDYNTLNRKANQLARLLLERGIESGQRVGVMMDRSIDMILAMIAIHKAGCAYVPLDPVYPADRLSYMVEDSGLIALLTETEHKTKLGQLDVDMIVHDEMIATMSAFPDDNLSLSVSSDCLAYVIYTSGSTGKPKGVMVEHRNVVNFFVGMDQCIGRDPGVWLAVTSISFDISVLEIFWTLSRGFKVVIYSDKSAYEGASSGPEKTLDTDIDFSLFYWNVADEESHHQPDKYQLLLEGAKFADSNGFKAVWNPERHFASFGGLFPNPAVTCAALATITEKVELRAGSCVVPLHSPIRVAEEWAVVDNLSNGRVGMAVASGWAPPDFAIKPENYADAKNIMFESLEQVRRLWRGEKVTFPGPTGDVEVRTLPRPIQKELPYWVTTAGNEDTFKRAGEAGANILTHLLGQTFDEVKAKIAAYREAWKAAGHPGQGTITLMLHTFIGESMEQVEDMVRQPMKDYLKSAMFLVKGAAWNFPTFKKMSEETGKSLDEFFETISDEDMDDLLEFAFQRYFRTSGLFGTPVSAVDTVAKCLEIGVDEIACLIDYGIDTDIVMQHLPYLNQLKQNCAPRGDKSMPVSEPAQGFTIPELIERHQITHFQCTPSMATMLVSDAESKASLKTIKHMMVGGEAMPAPLADALKESISGRLSNMYGPTETTIWSSTCDIDKEESISIGTPISNTQIYIVDQNLRALPVGVAGELVIGGDGVVRGYHDRPELTAERFVEGWQLTPDAESQRVYRTGDLARFESDGRLSCLGRIDHQVKIRGYRIELGEIEALLQGHDSVRECAVILREDKSGDKRLVAYIRPQYDAHAKADELKQHLSAQLPEFMVPAFYVEMQTMPLTPNGKLDRNALPEPLQQKHQNSGEFALPENDWENLIAEIWKRALGVTEVGRKDNFFDIGGHSLLVIQVLKELREHEKVSKAVQMTDLFRHTTIEALAQFIASDENESKGTEAASSRVAARKAAMSRRRRR